MALMMIGFWISKGFAGDARRVKGGFVSRISYLVSGGAQNRGQRTEERGQTTEGRAQGAEGKERAVSGWGAGGGRVVGGGTFDTSTSSV